MSADGDRNWEAQLTVPLHEMDLLILAEVEAIELAAEGQRMKGFHVLQQGLSRAQQEHQDGASYGDELVRHWQRTVDGYCRRHGDVLLEAG
jgi:hypothetical protein